jgi:D-3-phosphoglycerate dehydrogenase
MDMQNETSFPRDKMKILLLEGIHPLAVEELRKSGYTDITAMPGALTENELMDVIGDYHLLGIRSKTNVTEAVIAKAHKLLAIGCFCIGTNQVSMQAATAAGIAVFNSPFSNTRSVAELVIAEAIMLMRHIFEKNEAAHRGVWQKDSRDCFEVRGKILGIIGYGHIGSQVSVLAESLGMKVVYFDTEPKLPLGNAEAAKDLEQLLRVSDIITLHVPGTPLTKNMISAQRLSMFKKGAILLNLSRGDVIDTHAVKEAILSGHLGGLGVDVFPNEPAAKGDEFISPLQGLPNVILTPHVGGSTVEAQASIGMDVAGKMISFTETGSSVGCLSIPALTLPLQHDTSRLLHIHRNVPGVLSEINSVLSDHNVNILGQYLKTSQHIGYVVLDVDRSTPASVMEELKKIKNTIRTRSVF